MISVAILGATGTVGQKIILLLEGHPNFEVCEVVASSRSVGKLYHQACAWKQAIPIPERIARMRIRSLDDTLNSSILFSGLDSTVAGEAESVYAQRGHVVISNAKNHRMDFDVPLVIPEINYDHLFSIKKQSYSGAIITNPNCSTMGLALALAPLHKMFGIQKAMVHTMQAISGAGYPGVASIDIVDNIIPFIADEEEKIETEPKKILGSYEDTIGFVGAPFTISAHCNRVAVTDGHTECVSISFENKPNKADDIITAWNSFSGFPQEQRLPIAPIRPVLYIDRESGPQPLLDRNKGDGMTVTIGRLRPCSLYDYKFVLLSHNTIRGAGVALLNAEAALSMELLSAYL